jgi:hypothetical protein
MSKQAEADLILKLYDLRREATMRKAREWYFRQFHPESAVDIKEALLGENSAYLRMVTTYWDMVAGLVNYGSISLELFNDTTGEHIGVFAKLEPFLDEARRIFGPQLFINLEKLIDATPDGRARAAAVRDRAKAIRAELAARQSRAAASQA